MSFPSGPSSGPSNTRQDKQKNGTKQAKSPSLEQRENGLLRELINELESLKDKSKKVKTEEVKESIDKECGLLSLLMRNRNVLSAIRAAASLPAPATSSGISEMRNLKHEIASMISDSQKELMGALEGAMHSKGAPLKSQTEPDGKLLTSSLESIAE